MTAEEPPITATGVLITSDTQSQQLAAVRALAKLMDTAFVVPGTNIRIGLDSIIGLIPGIGDVIGSVIGGYIVMVASRMGVPRVVIWRMLLNLGIDTVVGAVPVVGDMLDVAWKANVMNVALLEKALADSKAARRGSVWVLVGLVCAVVLLAAASAALMWLALSYFFGHGR
ncbi:MAG: hypothetical protein JWO38_7085 [Gemmataceae bacterium]|nr:hypothetical protein [Gemmataceae bacterium]